MHWVMEMNLMVWFEQENCHFCGEIIFHLHPNLYFFLNLWWKSNPKMRQHVKYLQTTQLCLTWRIHHFKSIVTWTIGSNLLPLADESHKPMQGHNFSVQPNFSKQALCMTAFVVPMSKNIEIFFCELLHENLLSF